MLPFDYSSTLHRNGLGSCWQRWHCHKNCVMLFTLYLHNHPNVWSHPTSGVRHLTALWVQSAVSALGCYIRMVHFLLGTPTQLYFTCNGTNNYDKCKKKRLHHYLFDFWKKLTQTESNFNWMKSTLFHQ